jgi:hypothetical protein
MEIFGIIGMSLGAIGMTFGIICLSKIQQLIKDLKAKEVLEKEYK